MRKSVILSGFISLFLVGSLLFPIAAGTVLASRNSGINVLGNDGPNFGYRPGWGFGDKNHVHTGPPGLEGKDVPGKGPKKNP